MRIIREDPEKEIFAGEVQRWLIGELTVEDRRNILGRANLSYHFEFAVYNTMPYFKSRYMATERGRLVELGASAAAAADVDVATRVAAALMLLGEVAEAKYEPEDDVPFPSPIYPPIQKRPGRTLPIYKTTSHLHHLTLTKPTSLHSPTPFTLPTP